MSIRGLIILTLPLLLKSDNHWTIFGIKGVKITVLT